ncbi:MAG: BON domain-containing protein [Deltaproteobacteria bacterium]
MITRDEALCRKIQNAFEQDQRVAARSIDVRSTRGIVSLRGCASTRTSMLAAIEIAASFSECRGVVNRQVLARMPEPRSQSLWSLPAGDGMIGRSAFACLPNDGIPASVYDSGAIPGQYEDAQSLRHAG